ncbi:carboxypeptidase-like regulatory domain-containing protein [Marivirga sp.]|uniref:carboxypeptidase-like regulatory domain-containing protein n=1 Tax=Marivirga sp. TaxID=2018662 RepID=UPI002D80ED3A|nr:carboxypeptidase-like regulatory domain-containing protein [Marivirga sp.]HET8860761.1 carboxypeptidase-like regulatory domain-containing protein [Marivirga sp.]
MKLINLTILLFIIASFSDLHAQIKKGRVASNADNVPIEGVHIVNTSANKMAISDQNGLFYIVANPGDTLIASNVNFKSKIFVINNEQFLKFKLNPAVIQLDEVRVSNIPETESDFKRKMVGMDNIEDKSIKIDGLMPTVPKGKIPKNYDPGYTNSFKYAINKPLSFIVKKLNKNYKNKVKYYQIVANHSNTIANNKKYNPEIVTNLTGLKGDELVDFIQFLDLDPAFVKRSSEYEIALHIIKEFEHYTARKG